MTELLDAPLLTIGEAAERLRLSPSAVRRRIWSGEIRALRLGSGSCPPVRIEPSELRRYCAENPAVSAADLQHGEAVEPLAHGGDEAA